MYMYKINELGKKTKATYLLSIVDIDVKLVLNIE